MGLHEILKSGRISHNICTPPFVGISPSIEPETVNTSALKHGPQTVLKSPTVQASNAPHPHLSLSLLPCLSLSLCLPLPISPSFAFSLSVFLPMSYSWRGLQQFLMTTCPCSSTVLCHARPSSKHPRGIKGSYC